MKRIINPSSKTLMAALEVLQKANREELIVHWRKLYDFPVPVISTVMLRRALAFKIQERNLGALNPELQLLLKKKAARLDAHAPVLIESGTRIVRQWRGITYEVIIISNGVLLDGVHLSSLSEAAYRITGTKWSGPRFFGLGRKPR